MVEKKVEEDVTEIWEEMQMSGNTEGAKNVVETASDLGASSKEVELGEKDEHEQDVTKALLVL